MPYLSSVSPLAIAVANTKPVTDSNHTNHVSIARSLRRALALQPKCFSNMPFSRHIERKDNSIKLTDETAANPLAMAVEKLNGEAPSEIMPATVNKQTGKGKANAKVKSNAKGVL